MNILCVNGRFGDQLQALGHTVTNVALAEPGLYRLTELVDLAAVRPDLLIQEESLGLPVLLEDLSEAGCIKAFWSIDSHLNIYWHHLYARLFDVLLTPHLSWFADLPPEWRHPQMKRFAWIGSVRPWKAHAQRKRDLLFVGKVSESRPLRQLFVSYLTAQYQMEQLEGVSSSEMLRLYDDTRLLPNECIAFESNFRVLEGASCGSCVLTPAAVGDDQNALLEPGKEIILYQDAVELRDIIGFCLRKPRMAEMVGQAAQQRIQAEHLPVHRAAVLEGLAASPRAAVSGQAADEALCLALLQLWSNNLQLCSKHDLKRRLASLSLGQEGIAAALAFLAECDDSEGLRNLFAQLKDRPDFTSFSVASAAAASAIRIQDFELLQTITDCYRQANGDETEPPQSLFEHCLFWAARLAASGRASRLGVQVDTLKKCPLSALEMLHRASICEPNKLVWTREMLRLPVIEARLPLLALGCKARLALEPGCTWQDRLQFALENFRCFRFQEGLEEITQTVRLAALAGESSFLLQALQASANPPILRLIQMEMARQGLDF